MTSYVLVHYGQGVIVFKQIVTQYPVQHEQTIVNSAAFDDLQWKRSISEANPGDTGVGQEGRDGAVASRLPDHVPDLAVKLGEPWACVG